MKSFTRISIWIVAVSALLTVSCKENSPSIESDQMTGNAARNAVPDTTIVEKPEVPAKPEWTDELFRVTAVSPDSIHGKGVFLTFTSEKNLGCGTPFLSTEVIFRESAKFEILITDLYVNKHCQGQHVTAGGQVFLYPIEAGESSFSILIGDKTYKGKIIRRDNQFIFEWPDESQFIFPEKILNL